MHFRIACMKNSFLTASSSISNFHCSRSKSCSFRIHLLEPNVYCKCFKKRNVDLLTMFLKKFTVKFLVLLSIRDDIFVKYLSGFFITFIILHIFFIIIQAQCCTILAAVFRQKNCEIIGRRTSY